MKENRKRTFRESENLPKHAFHVLLESDHRHCDRIVVDSLNLMLNESHSFHSEPNRVEIVRVALTLRKKGKEIRKKRRKNKKIKIMKKRMKETFEGSRNNRMGSSLRETLGSGTSFALAREPTAEVRFLIAPLLTRDTSFGGRLALKCPSRVSQMSCPSV